MSSCTWMATNRPLVVVPTRTSFHQNDGRNEAQTSHCSGDEVWPQWIWKWRENKQKPKQKVAMMYLIHTHELQFFQKIWEGNGCKRNSNSSIITQSWYGWCRRHMTKHFLCHWVSQSNFFKHPRWVNWNNQSQTSSSFNHKSHHIPKDVSLAGRLFFILITQPPLLPFAFGSPTHWDLLWA